MEAQLKNVCEDPTSLGRSIANVLQYCSTGGSVIHGKGAKAGSVANADGKEFGFEQ
jgi:hypothetical protein